MSYVDYSTMSDDDLASQAKHGDEEALVILIKKFEGNVQRRLGYLVPTGEVEDVAQDVFLALTKDISKFKGKSSFQTWFFKIVSNKAADYHRKAARENMVRRDELWPASPRVNRPTLGLGYGDFEDIVADLPDHYKEVLHLKFQEGLDFSEIASRLSLAYEAVRSRYRRAMRQVALDILPESELKRVAASNYMLREYM